MTGAKYLRMSRPGEDPLEMRATPRVGADYPVQVYSSEFSGPLVGRTRDLGVGGLCVATSSPFSFKSITQVGLGLPDRTLLLPAQGCWQREEPADELMLTGVSFKEASAEDLNTIWSLVLDAGKHLARFMYENSDVRELGLEEAMGLAQITRFRDIRAGRSLYRQGTRQPGETSLFLLMRGIVVLQVRVKDAIEVEIARLQPGEIFGGTPIIASVPHPESAVAETDVRLLEIDEAAFRYIRCVKPWLGYRLGTAMTRTSALRLSALLKRLETHL